MLAVLAVGDDPGDRRQLPRPRVGEEVRRGLDVAELLVLNDGYEVRQWVPDRGRADVLGLRRTHHLPVAAVGLRPLRDVVAPRDTVLVQEVGEVGPAVVLPGPMRVRALAPTVDVRRARLRPVRI